MELKPTVIYASIGIGASVFVVIIFLGIASQAMMTAMYVDLSFLPGIVRFLAIKFILGGLFLSVFSAFIGYSYGQLKQQTQRLQKANAARDQFVSILGHDLRSPLASVSGYLDLLSDGYDRYDDAIRKKYIQSTYTATKRLSDLVEDLLEWGRIQLGQASWQPEMSDLFHLADEAVIVLEGNAEKKQIALRVQIPVNTPMYADPQMVKTIIRNLVSNAIKFTEPGGQVTIASQAIGNAQEVLVTDTGVGIKPDDLKKLFRIDRIHSTPGTAKERGSGLGLLLCKEFVEKHGGTIQVESAVGQGSVFRFTLPHVKGAPQQVAQADKQRRRKEEARALPEQYCVEYDL